MSVRRLADQQPDSFAFTKASEQLVTFWLNKYPEAKKASAVIPMLWIAQKQEGWVSEPAIQHIAERLGMPRIRVYEVATFYTMFNLAPAGEHFIQVCGTTPCWLRGAGDLKAVCEKRIGKKGVVSKDGKFSWNEVECLGACANAPMVQISNKDGDEYYEDLTAESLTALLDALEAGKAIKPGPQNGRDCSAPEGEAKTLTEKSLYDGSMAKPIKLPNAANDTAPAAAPAQKPTKAAKPVAKTKPTPPKLVKEAVADGAAPKLFERPDGEKDDLKRIGGIGPKIEALLNEMGVFHFHQIAGWTAEEVSWVNSRLKFKGRIEREDWVAQARLLSEAK